MSELERAGHNLIANFYEIMTDQADSDCTNRPGLFGVPLRQQQSVRGTCFMTNSFQPINPSKTSSYQQGMEADGETMLKYAAERLKTFRFWRKYLMPKASQLASAGFIYTNQGDRVRCFACHVLLCDWKRSEDPFEEHYKWSKDCEFLKVCYAPDTKQVFPN
jgi:hypothetical protein